MSIGGDEHLMLQEIADIVGADFVRQALEADAVDGVPPRLAVEPEMPSEVARVLALANEKDQRVIPRGGGTKLGWGNSPDTVDVVLSLRRLNRVLEHAAGDMTATVEAGCTIAALQESLAERGQRLALDPMWPNRATVGGVLATADSGSLRWAFGPPRDLLLGVTVALADGTLARSGGKVVKNVAGYDLPKLFTGSFGTLGVITQATFRLHPLPAAVTNLAFALDATTVAAFVAAMRECSLVTTAVQICVDWMRKVIAFVRIEGLSEAIEDKVSQVMRAATAAGAEVLESPSSSDGWSAGERLFDPCEAKLIVCKVAILPTNLQHLLSLLELEASDDVRWQLVLQGYGIAYLKLEIPEPVTSVVARLRSGIVGLGGSLVVLTCSSDLKPALDVWGEPGEPLELMRRIKERFDPRAVLNPGRFIGGI